MSQEFMAGGLFSIAFIISLLWIVSLFNSKPEDDDTLLFPMAIIYVIYHVFVFFLFSYVYQDYTQTSHLINELAHQGVTTQGVIIKVDRPSSDSFCEVIFEFEVEGKTYQVTRNVFNNYCYTSSKPRGETDQRVLAGDTIPVVYLPKDPSQAHWQGHQSDTLPGIYYHLFGAGGVFVIPLVLLDILIVVGLILAKIEKGKTGSPPPVNLRK